MIFAFFPAIVSKWYCLWFSFSFSPKTVKVFPSLFFIFPDNPIENNFLSNSASSIKIKFNLSDKNKSGKCLSVGIALLIYYSNVSNLKECLQRIVLPPLQKPYPQTLQNRQTEPTPTLQRTAVTGIVQHRIVANFWKETHLINPNPLRITNRGPRL